MGLNAQITYSGGRLNINDPSNITFLHLSINKWLGMYWTCKDSNFFQLDISPANPRLAGTGDEVVFFNTFSSSFNSIQVANVYQYSDARAKENIMPIATGLNTILQLHPVTYNWKSSEAIDTLSTTSVAKGPDEDGQQIGFLAQEVESIMPETVKTDSEGHKLINYTAIIPMLVKAIQELQTTVENQAMQIAQLSGNKIISQGVQNNKIIKCTPNPTTGSLSISTQLENGAKNTCLKITSLFWQYRKDHTNFTWNSKHRWRHIDFKQRYSCSLSFSGWSSCRFTKNNKNITILILDDFM